MLKNYSIPIIMWLVFESIAVILWQALDNIFYLFNFSYIGTSIAIGLFLCLQTEICPPCHSVCCWALYAGLSRLSSA